jgi:signal transduction histidine kinase
MIPAKDEVAASIVRARDELERALAGLEHLPAFDPGALGFAAHALNNYINVTGGTLDLLALKLGEYPDPEVHHWLNGLRHATNLMHRTAQQLMGTAAAGGAEVLNQTVNLNKLVRRSCDYYQKVADRKMILIDFESSVEFPYVVTDAVAVAAILDNLLSNAVKYSEPEKRIWVRVDGDGDQLVCSVRDEGPGISPEDQAKLFRRGVRLGAVPTGGEPSTGYGLAVAHELATKIGGEIRYESPAGGGACFSLRLPAHSVPEGA